LAEKSTVRSSVKLERLGETTFLDILHRESDPLKCFGKDF